MREDAVTGYFARYEGYDVTNTLLSVIVPNTAPGTTPDGDLIPMNPAGQMTAQRAASIVERKTGTPPPAFERVNEQLMGDYMDIIDYDTPLWGGLLGTGDETPTWPFAFAGAGALALALLAIFGRRRRQGRA